MKIEVFTQSVDYAGELNFYIFGEEPSGKRSICTDIAKMEFTMYEEGTPTEPTFTLRHGVTKPFLQAMANELSKLGVKAEGEPVLENELVATKYHLEDMRKLVFEPKN